MEFEKKIALVTGAARGLDLRQKRTSLLRTMQAKSRG
jgi:hypothetical protein